MLKVNFTFTQAASFAPRSAFSPLQMPGIDKTDYPHLAGRQGKWEGSEERGLCFGNGICRQKNDLAADSSKDHPKAGAAFHQVSSRRIIAFTLSERKYLKIIAAAKRDIERVKIYDALTLRCAERYIAEASLRCAERYIAEASLLVLWITSDNWHLVDYRVASDIRTEPIISVCNITACEFIDVIAPMPTTLMPVRDRGASHSVHKALGWCSLRCSSVVGRRAPLPLAALPATGPVALQRTGPSNPEVNTTGACTAVSKKACCR